MLDIISTKEWTTRSKPMGRTIEDKIPNMEPLDKQDPDVDDGQTLSDYATMFLDKFCAWRRDDE